MRLESFAARRTSEKVPLAVGSTSKYISDQTNRSPPPPAKAGRVLTHRTALMAGVIPHVGRLRCLSERSHQMQDKRITFNENYRRLADLWMSELELRTAGTRLVKFDEHKPEGNLNPGPYWSRTIDDTKSFISLDFSTPEAPKERRGPSMTSRSITHALYGDRYAMASGLYRVVTEKETSSADALANIIRTTDSSQLLNVAAGRAERAIRVAAAANPHLPIEVMWELVADPEKSVRLALARNAYTPLEILITLAEDPCPDVSRSACGQLARMYGQVFVEVRYRH